MKLAFKIASVFWLLAPCGFIVGRATGLWDFKHDIGVFSFLMLMMLLVAFLNYRPE